MIQFGRELVGPGESVRVVKHAGCTKDACINIAKLPTCMGVETLDSRQEEKVFGIRDNSS